MTDDEIQKLRQIRFLDNLKLIHVDLLSLRNSAGSKAKVLVAAADEAIQVEILAG